MINIEGNKPVWLINGQPAPVPTGELKIITSQLVDEGRNSNGQTIAQKIGRRLLKYDSVSWSYLTYDEWRWIVQHLENFECLLTYWDIHENGIVTRRFYFGDSSAIPFEWDSASYGVAKPLSFRNCSVNIIDMGY